jgi:hypothetical protein
MSPASVVSGLVFVVLGVLFLFDRLGRIALAPEYVWAILLIGLGVALLAGGRRRRPPPERTEDAAP